MDPREGPNMTDERPPWGPVLGMLLCAVSAGVVIGGVLALARVVW